MGRSSSAVHPPVADHVADGPVGLRIGDLVDQDQDQVVGDELAAGQPADASLARRGGPDEQIDQRRDHPAKRQQEEETAVLHPREPRSAHERKPPQPPSVGS